MHYLLTASGKKLDILAPKPEQIDLLDIAKALAKECRYAGHCKGHYSVAQHSTLASRIVSKANRLEALLHDATEAYLKDIPRPLKLLLPEYREIEHRLDLVIRTRFALPEEMSPEVTYADQVLLATEKRDLMPADPEPWPRVAGIDPLPTRVSPVPYPRAESDFLKRAIEIMQE